jgi:ribonucleoside-triphosphate reductase
MITVIKRDGREERFTSSKIFKAVVPAAKEAGYGQEEAEQIADTIAIDCQVELVAQTKDRDFGIPVDDVHNLVEKELMKNYPSVAKKYILYRDKRTDIREGKSAIIKTLDALSKEMSKDNANTDPSAATKHFQIASAVSKHYSLTKGMSKHFADAHISGDLHLHDLDYFDKTVNSMHEDDVISIMDNCGNVTVLAFKEFATLLDLPDSPCYKALRGYKVKSKSGWVNIKALIRKNLNSKYPMMNVALNNGLSLKATAEHKVPIVDVNSGERLVSIKDLKPGDKLIGEIEDHGNQEYIDVLDLIMQQTDEVKARVTIRNAYKLVYWLKFKYDDFAWNKIFGYRSSGKCGSSKIISFKEYEMIASKFPLPLQIKQELSVCVTKSRYAIPAIIPVTSNLARLFGYFASEGWISKADNGRRIVIANKNRHILDSIHECIEDNFNVNVIDHVEYKSQNVNGKAVNSSTLHFLFYDLFDLKGRSDEKKIPEFIFSGNSEIKYAFLSGLIDGDGSYSDKSIAYCTVSRQLAEKLTLLYSSLGIQSTTHIQKTNGTEYTCDGVTGTRNFDTYFVKVGAKEFRDKLSNFLTPLKATLEKQEDLPGITNKRFSTLTVRNVTLDSSYNGFTYDVTTEDRYFYSNGVLVHNCFFLPMAKMLREGFDNGTGYIRPPKRIGSACALYVIAAQAMQNQFFGGQGTVHFDYDLAPYAQMEYERRLKVEIYKMEKRNKYIKVIDPKGLREHIEKEAMEDAEEATYQAMESLIYNINTMKCRSGNQNLFMSLNLGDNTTHWGRMITRNLLKAFMAGLGRGENPLFPNLGFRLKEGVNYNPEDPNYDLFRLALECLSKRIQPRFVFADFSGVVGDWRNTARMGCRTNLGGNVHGSDDPEGRGNLFFTTINLPRIAIKSHNETAFKPLEIKRDVFWAKLGKMCDLVIQQLLERYNVCKKLKVRDMPFAMQWYQGSEGLKEDDCIEPAIKNGSLSMGFVGLAETLKLLTGEHHGENEAAQELGLRICQFMRNKIDTAKEKYNLNFSFFATPAESVAGRLLKLDRDRFGVIPGVTDKEFYSNSFHIPVDFECSISHKIDTEAPYHVLTNAGHISYVELPSMPKYNIDALEQIVRHMKEADMGYAGINFVHNFCNNCGFIGDIDETCPICGSDSIKRTAIITGYLSSEDKFNPAKLAELKARKSHGGKISLG